MHGKKSTGSVQPGFISPTRPVSSDIVRPPYALSGDPGPSSTSLVRSREEISAMRQTGSLAAEVLLYAAQEVKPGVTTDYLDSVAHEIIIENRAYPSPLNYRGFPKSICTSINEVICHGIPDSRKLQDGDIINLDVTVYKDGVHGDTSATFFVGEPPSSDAVRLVSTTYEALYAGIDAVKPGAVVSDIGRAIEACADAEKLSVVREFIGHGIGVEFHSALAIPHYFDESHSHEFEAGMTFTIEPMLNLGVAGARIWDDNWTAVTLDNKLSAQFEHTLIVSEDGAEILTLTRAGECAHSHHQAIPLTPSPAAAIKL